MLSTEYLAGLFDGEGCIHIPVQNPERAVPSYGVRVMFCLTHERVVREIAEQFGVAYCRLKKNHANWRDAFQVTICGERAAGLLRAMLPSLIVKREEAELAIRLQDHITRYRNSAKRWTDEQKKSIVDYREGLRLQIKALKRAGAFDGMTVNSGEPPCPARNGAEGQSRAKQANVVSFAGRV